ncbi:RHS repeat protein [Sphingomonas sp. CBMAI 2297]|uniref:RHS repeat protein n=1 Tax=Sphingomonas sp. CBMAI 2297 TaxID=2991720 RepID=UPI002455897C|nr:RHS repeat protein [Sphingomonas sp. CBMAI 2297]MDH4742853.1 RHS repeat protein [Sphingomonas sp. CBMAI 2297]
MPAIAQTAPEQTKYEYDALGRLVKVTTESSARGDTRANYSYDPAGNRTNVKVETSVRRAFVVPLNGFTVIPLK